MGEYFSDILGTFDDILEDILEVCLGMFSGYFEGALGIIVGYFRDDLEDILVIYCRRYVRSMLRTSWGHVMDTQRMF